MAVASPCLMIKKGNTDSKHAKSMCLAFKINPLEKKDESAPKNESRELSNAVCFLERIAKQSAGL